MKTNRKSILLAVCIGLGLAMLMMSQLAGPASAAVYTDTASFNASSLLPALGPPIPYSSLQSAAADQNQLFTNGTTAFFPAGGSGVNTVGAVLISAAQYGTLTGNKNLSGIVAPNGEQYVAIFGLRDRKPSDERCL